MVSNLASYCTLRQIRDLRHFRGGVPAEKQMPSHLLAAT